MNLHEEPIKSKSRANQEPIKSKSIFSINFKSIFPIKISINIISRFCMKKYWLKSWFSNLPSKSIAEKTKILIVIIMRCSGHYRFGHVSSMYRGSRLRSTLNTSYITGLDMCQVCTEAVDCVALWTRVTLQVWTCVKYVPRQSIA